VVNFDDYAVVIVKSFSCNNLRANEYSAVTLKPGRYKDMRQIGPFSVAPPVCARALRARSHGPPVGQLRANSVFSLQPFFPTAGGQFPRGERCGVRGLNEARRSGSVV
jgi:hypothetical protein